MHAFFFLFESNNTLHNTTIKGTSSLHWKDVIEMLERVQHNMYEMYILEVCDLLFCLMAKESLFVLLENDIF